MPLKNFGDARIRKFTRHMMNSSSDSYDPLTMEEFLTNLDATLARLGAIGIPYPSGFSHSLCVC